MIVPNFWAEVSTKGEVDGRRVTIRRFGWSNESEAEAVMKRHDRMSRANSDLPIA